MRRAIYAVIVWRILLNVSLIFCRSFSCLWYDSLLDILHFPLWWFYFSFVYMLSKIGLLTHENDFFVICCFPICNFSYEWKQPIDAVIYKWAEILFKLIGLDIIRNLTTSSFFDYSENFVRHFQNYFCIYETHVTT